MSPDPTAPIPAFESNVPILKGLGSGVDRNGIFLSLKLFKSFFRVPYSFPLPNLSFSRKVESENHMRREVAKSKEIKVLNIV